MSDQDQRSVYEKQAALSVSIRKNSRKVGKNNMITGAIILLVGVLLAAWLYMNTNSSDFYKDLKLPGGMIIAGGFLFFLGIAQVTKTKDALDMEKRKANKFIYGVEEPDSTWECQIVNILIPIPLIHAKNVNTN